jgi:ABC-type polysaccharide/polyol phosphate transport system ATPase subunit
MHNYAIRVNGITKKFRVHIEKNNTLKEKILYAGRNRFREFIALRDVSLDVVRGSTVGLLGVNGSGKSTLLKIMSRILYPDSGNVEVNGRVSSLLELGAGFHPDFSGRENIFMNGALLGLSKREIGLKLDEIIDFSELGDFIDEPVRSYSSGMYMRLAFSVAVAVNPEILLIDEILAVGDAAFQAKCMSRIQELKAGNKTIIIVTHDTSAVERFCDEAVWMHDAHIRMQGEPVNCIQSYLETVFQNSHSGFTMSFDHNRDDSSEKQVEQSLELDESLEPESADERLRWGSREIYIEHVSASSESGAGIVSCGMSLRVSMNYMASSTFSNVAFGIGFYAENGQLCYGTNTYLDRMGELKIQEGIGQVVFEVDDFSLLPGSYWIDVACHTIDGMAFDYWRKAIRITVFSDITDIGVCRLPHVWGFTEVRDK